MDACWPIAIDRRYQDNAAELHRPLASEDLAIEGERLRVIRSGFHLEAPAGLLPELGSWRQALQAFFCPLGGRLLYTLYALANDEPYWRMPDIEIAGDELLDRLCFRRDPQQRHYSSNRNRIRSALAAAHFLTVHLPDERPRPLVTVAEWAGSDLWPRKLPARLHLHLGFYSGVRIDRNHAGRRYVLVPRRGRAMPRLSPSAERLAAYLTARHHQLFARGNVLRISRGIAVEKAGIRSENRAWARRTLEQALDGLVRAGILDEYSPVPKGDDDVFECRWGRAITGLPNHRWRPEGP